MKVVTYRLSTSECDAARELGQQANKLTVFLYQNGHELFDDFWDIGTPCAGLAAALATLTISSVDGLLVVSLDRLGCDIASIQAVAAELRKIGIALVTVSEGIIDLEVLAAPACPKVEHEWLGGAIRASGGYLIAAATRSSTVSGESVLSI